MNRCAQIGLAAARKLAEETKQAKHLLSSSPERQRRLQMRRKGRTADAIKVFETDIAQRGGDLFGVVDLRRRTLGHRSAGVDQQINVDFLLSREHLQEQPLQTPVDIPVDV